MSGGIAEAVGISGRGGSARSERLRVAAIPERYGRALSPCASIRIEPFLEAMKGEGDIELRYLLPSEIEKFKPDVVIWHRVSISDSADIRILREFADRTGCKLIYDIDDNLLDMDGHGEAEAYASLVRAVRESLNAADEVWCSTPKLAERVGREFAARTHVCPNALDPQLWALTGKYSPSVDSVKAQGPLRLLYMGTRTHDEDFALLEEALSNIEQRRRGRFTLSLIGVRAREKHGSEWMRILHPIHNVGASYPAFVHWFRELRGFDLGVAPLLSNRFNACKSPIKVLDYAAIGLPTLASAVPAYEHLPLAGGVNCLHAANDVPSWVGALESLIEDRSALGPVASRAAELVSPHQFQGAVSLRWRLLADDRGAYRA